MLIVIDDTVLDLLQSEPPINGEVICTLDNIATARRTGAHLVFASRRALKSLSACPYLNESSRRIYLHLYNRSTTIGDLSMLFSQYLEVTCNTPDLRVVDSKGRRVIKCPPTGLSNPYILDKTILLCENLTDADFFYNIARFYMRSQRLENVALSHRPVLGGGSTMAEMYKLVCRQKDKLCLCVVDSDRAFPCDKGIEETTHLGDTAKKVLSVCSDYPYPLAEAFVLQVREAENLVPLQVCEDVVRDDPNKVKFVFVGASLLKNHPDALLYLDVKKGIKLGDIIHDNPAGAYPKYWGGIIASLRRELCDVSNDCWETPKCINKAACTCKVTPSLGDSYLSKVAEHLSKMTPHKMEEIMSEPFLKLWEQLGAVLAAWLCGAKPVAAA